MSETKFTLLLILCLLSCKNDSSDSTAIRSCQTKDLTYGSDYFVFIADDQSSPLVIPVDVNWRPTSNGYEEEFKAWFGTSEPWPIAYHVQKREAVDCTYPTETWEHSSNQNFQFDAANRLILLSIPNTPKIELAIPESDQWVLMPSKGTKSIYAMRTTAFIDGNVRSGWMIYERIRRSGIANGGGGRDFGAFYWIPLIVNGRFYHFEQHRDHQTATRWSLSGHAIIVDSLSSFELEVLETSSDSVSGRTLVPDQLKLTAPKWDLNITLKSGGSQVGYGPEFPNGLAYYRQSLLQSTSSSLSVGYGMLELILEDD